MFTFLILYPPVCSAMNDLLQTMAVAGGPGAQWAGSIENLDGAEAGDAGMMGSSRRGGQRMKELALSTNAIDCAALTLPSAGRSRAKLRLQVKGRDVCFVCDYLEELTPHFSYKKGSTLGFYFGLFKCQYLVDLLEDSCKGVEIYSGFSE